MANRSQDEPDDRLEQIMQILAEDQHSLQQLVSNLATETRRGFDQGAAQFRKTDARMDKLARKAQSVHALSTSASTASSAPLANWCAGRMQQVTFSPSLAKSNTPAG